ncbi:MAG: nucleotidyltransferase domain-containing protein [Nanoarchaeota archaeon]|nr:nucleotidyltransferase domain-containing protein [Nanoarchaeota archaeon]
MVTRKKFINEPKERVDRPDQPEKVEDLGVPLEEAAERAGSSEEKAINAALERKPRDDAKEKKKEPDEIDKKKRIEILKKFTSEVLKKHGSVIRSIVLFGSTARGTERGESDIDVFMIIDDTRQRLTPALRDKIEWEIEDIAKACSKHLSIQQPYTLTEFWRLVREGHPIVFNFIREGVPVYDKDIFLPIKRLLQMGEIRPSKEAVEKFIDRGPQRIRRVKNAKMYMVVEDLYYAMLESAQAVLMFLGKTPPRPVDAPKELRKILVPMKLMTEHDVKQLEDVIEIRKGVEHKRIKFMTGAQLDKWISVADKFVSKMRSLIVKIEILKRESMVQKSYAIMTETAMTLMRSMGKRPAASESFNLTFKKHLITTHTVPEHYLEVLTNLDKMRKLIKRGKILSIPKNDILAQREYVRKFIREAGKILRKSQFPEKA